MAPLGLPIPDAWNIAKATTAIGRSVESEIGIDPHTTGGKVLNAAAQVGLGAMTGGLSYVFSFL